MRKQFIREKKKSATLGSIELTQMKRHRAKVGREA
jgi:hypothetical protein